MAKLFRGVAFALSVLASGPVIADTALVIGNAQYETVGNVTAAQQLRRAGDPLRDAGFAVYATSNAEIDEIRSALSQLLRSGEERAIVIALSGHFVHSETGETWFLGTDTRRLDLATVGAQGVALSVILEIAAAAPGRAVVLLGAADQGFDPGPGLAQGVDLPDPPQGVAVLVTTPRRAAEFARGALPRSDRSLVQMLATYPDIQTAGFVTDAIPLIAGSEVVVPRPEPVTSPTDTAEDDLWDAVSELNTEGAYISYLRQYPTGRYAAAARAAFEELRDPLRGASEAETALGLTRPDRRAIQRDLTVLGFDTRGIDGIFGNGTRSAIRNWQSAEGLNATGYLTASDLRRLSSSADVRREEIAAEEAIQQAERQRLDRAYWNATGRGQDEAGLRAYLARYPDGLFSDVASERLAEIDAAAGRVTRAAEEDAWSFAERQDSVGAYRGYLAAYPQGTYSREAQNRIAELRGQPVPFPEVNVAELEAAEAALNLPGITRLLIERRLEGNGYRPGPTDGRFDDQTRAAIASFQEDNGLTPTGYLDQRTLSRFLSDGIQIILR